MQVYLDSWGYLLPEHCEKLLDISIERATKSCERLYPKFSTFTENRRNALTDFMFNVGEGTAKEFKKANAAINEGKWVKAAKEFVNSDWFTQVGKRSSEIVSMIRDG